jgi:GntR family transcriptional regulator
MIQFSVDRGSGVPAYLQIVQQVKASVRLGVLVAGEQLPTVRQVAELSRVNPNTVLKAYRELALTGVVEIRVGSGTYVLAADALSAERAQSLEEELWHWVGSAYEAGFDPADIRAMVTRVLDRASVLSGGEAK